ncbi:MAG: hypothetical protein Q8S73_10570 [Deltaproteobacteria bacterium]|nr:hypothetical protein [Myxococcales bacterium]MDP3214537.1 hypothetical protein [Deltaproteobacteria bacterium]
MITSTNVSLSPQWDAGVLGPDGRPSLLIEIKARRGLDETWAKTWMTFVASRALGAHAVMLVTPEHLFYWNEPSVSRPSPSTAIDAKPVLSPYLSAIGGEGRIEPMVFVNVVVSWLRDVADGEHSVPQLPDLEGRLRSGSRLLVS